ncbi:MAG: class I SAM-dependent methyltransferase, partial [Syntrophaceae bacterium]|nr:class I SAM-dependent methyltransferase [Syntrophaceae bacterium]
MRRFHFIPSVTIVLCLLFVGVCAGQSYTPQSGQAGKDVIWVPTPQELVDTMLDMANVTSSDYVIDLGSGDGRTVITAAKRGATALGIEYNPDMVEFARRAADKEGVSAKAKFEQADIFESDFSKANVITLFLLPGLNLKLRPTLLDMKPGTRVVSNVFDMGDWKPDQTTSLRGAGTAHLWIVPAKVGGTWKIDDGHINFTQNFQNITGTLTVGKKDMALSGKLNGDRISFTADGTEYV